MPEILDNVLAAACALAVSSMSAAQGPLSPATFTIETRTPVVLVATIAGGTPATNSRPPGVTLTNPTLLDAESSGANRLSGPFARITRGVRVLPSEAHVQLSAVDTINLRGDASGAPSSAFSTLHEILVTATPTRPLDMQIEIDRDVLGAVPGVLASVDVDVGDDGTFEFSARGTGASRTVVALPRFSMAPVPILIRSSIAASATRLGMTSLLSLRMVPSHPVSATTVGSCSGQLSVFTAPLLDGGLTMSIIDNTVTASSMPTLTRVLLFGRLLQTPIPLPFAVNSNCALLVAPGFSLPIPLTTGPTTLRIPSGVGMAARPFDIDVQLVGMQPPMSLHSSDPLTLRFR